MANSECTSTAKTASKTKKQIQEELKAKMDQINLRRTDPMQIFSMKPSDVAKIRTDGRIQILAEHNNFTSVEIYDAPTFVIVEIDGEKTVYSRYSKQRLLACDAFVKAYYGEEE
ncbi:MAG: hypothetical protein IJX99_03535 [Clostridia bacterium]|nr:hypothetical protein [Clostridia bacterium]